MRPGNVWMITLAAWATLPGCAFAQTTQSTPILLSGRVAVEDGSALPAPAAIVRMCNGMNPHTEGYTDSSGAFQIQFGYDQSVLQDASETGRSQGAMRGGGGGQQAEGRVDANPPGATSERKIRCRRAAGSWIAN